VPVSPDSQNLQVDSSRLANGAFIRQEVFLIVAADFSVGNVNFRGRNVDMVEKILPHESVKALRMFAREPQVLVEVKSYHSGKIQPLLLAQPHQLLIHPQGRAPRRQSQRHIGLTSHRPRNDSRRLAAHLFVA
jgi:hypothetical protein